MNHLRDIPSVDALLQHPRADDLQKRFGRSLLLSGVRSVLEDTRIQLVQSPDKVSLDVEFLLEQVETVLVRWVAPSLVPVINATGVILHTNLGRAPLSPQAIRAINETASGYCTLEYDLTRGGRGSRSVHAEMLLQRLTGAEAALVVNNNAAAVLLVLTALARRRGVLISRTQLVEIGGGFRVPEVMAQSGAKLIEVGTTNRVRLEDYEDALHSHPVSLVLRAHHSNFRIIGFTTEPSLKELVELAHRHNLPLMDDLGSGALLDTARFGLAHEPMVQESLAAGADVVCFSGDKLLGGPQAGIILGRKEWLARIKKHPLARAVRPDKLTLAALSATLIHYLKGEAEQTIPVWRMIAQTPECLRERALAWQTALGSGEVLASLSTVGGGSLPEETLPTYVLALTVQKPNAFLAALRKCTPPVIARIEEERVMLDPRTVLPEQDSLLLHHLSNLLQNQKRKEATS
ncbi:MAG: L-seryl-tRNA(Sec) selenium transferase [Anaerolinea sp.]